MHDEPASGDEIVGRDMVKDAIVLVLVLVLAEARMETGITDGRESESESGEEKERRTIGE